MTSIGWMRRAACRDLDTNLFFCPDGERGDARRAREDAAKRVCTRCPAVRDCLDWALANEGLQSEGYRSGVYGGMTPAERALIAHTRVGSAA